MSQRIVRGYVWFAYPDALGLDLEEITDPGHPFATPSGDIKAPEEVLYFRPIDPRDAGIRNEAKSHAYLVITKTQHHPRLTPGWESDPAGLTDKFRTADGRMKMSRMIQVHRRHAGDLVECEMAIEPLPVAVGA